MIGRPRPSCFQRSPMSNTGLPGRIRVRPASLTLWNQLKLSQAECAASGQSWRKVGETDLAPYLSPILQTKPDCIISAAGGGGVVNFLKAVKAMGLAGEDPHLPALTPPTPLPLPPLVSTLLKASWELQLTTSYIRTRRRTRPSRRNSGGPTNATPGSTALLRLHWRLYIAKALSEGRTMNAEKFNRRPRGP